VVADAGAISIRVYDSNGEFQTELGSEGEGPGEFLAIGNMRVAAPDTIQVWDFFSQRITTFLADGSLVGTQRIDPAPPDGPGGFLDLLAGVFSDGDIALGWTVGGRIAGDGERQVAPDRVVFGRFGPDGQLRHLLGEGEGLHRIQGSPDPFSPVPRGVVFRDSLYFMNGVGGRIAVFDSEREGVARVLEIPAPHVEVSEAWSALNEALRVRGDESVLERIPDPRLAHTPTFGGMLMDDQGLIWVKIYDPESDSVYMGHPPGPGGEWWVITPDGEVVAKVAMPEGLIPVHIKGDRLLGVARGELDVESVVLHIIGR